MKNIIELAKGNPLVVAAIAIALLSIAALFFFVKPMGNDFVAEMDKRKTDVNKIKSLMSSQLNVPSEKPDEPPKSITVVINQATNEALTKVYNEMRMQSVTLFGTAAAINKEHHAPMLENLFPENNDPAIPFQAKDEFLRQIRAMFSKPSVADKNAPRLNASGTLSVEEIDANLLKVTNKFLAGFFPRKTETELTDEDKKTLAKLRAKAVFEQIRDHAERISIYASMDDKLDDFPFHIGAWARAGTRPSMADIWEGQMSLWIQQDIVRAIALANKPVREEGSLHQRDQVLTAPIKHLLKIHIFDEYVGFDGSGGQGRVGQVANNQTQGPGMEFFRPDTTRVIIEEMKSYNADQRLPEMFNVSMTGRVTNPLYDVRHAQVEVIAEYRQLPALFDAIGKVNLMTVLETHIEEIDEYDALAVGYMYGANDCVRVRLLVETIWLREWTGPLMPPSIKDKLGIVAKPVDPAAPGTPAPLRP